MDIGYMTPFPTGGTNHEVELLPGNRFSLIYRAGHGGYWTDRN